MELSKRHSKNTYRSKKSLTDQIKGFELGRELRSPLPSRTLHAPTRATRAKHACIHRYPVRHSKILHPARRATDGSAAVKSCHHSPESIQESQDPLPEIEFSGLSFSLVIGIHPSFRSDFPDSMIEQESPFPAWMS